MELLFNYKKKFFLRAILYEHKSTFSYFYPGIFMCWIDLVSSALLEKLI